MYSQYQSSQQFDETVCINNSFICIYTVFKHSAYTINKFLSHISFSKGLQRRVFCYCYKVIIVIMLLTFELIYNYNDPHR